MVEVWRVADEWGWCRPGEPGAPTGAEIVVQDRVQNSDADPTHDETAIASYAGDIFEWLRAEAED
jgi:hypothetical protein